MKNCKSNSLQNLHALKIPAKIPKVNEDSFKKIKIYSSKEKKLKENNNDPNKLTQVKTLKKQISLDRIKTNNKKDNNNEVVKINLHSLYSTPKKVENIDKLDKFTDNYQDKIIQNEKHDEKNDSKRMIQRPNTALNIVSVNENARKYLEKKEDKKKFDYEKNRIFLQKIKKMNNNLKISLKTNSRKVSEEKNLNNNYNNEIDNKENKRSSSLNQKSKTKVDNEENSYNSIYNFTFKPEDIKRNNSSFNQKSNNKDNVNSKQIINFINKNTKEQINKINNIGIPKSNTKTSILTDEKENIDRLNGIYHIKNEIREVKQPNKSDDKSNDKYNDKTNNKIVDKIQENKQNKEQTTYQFTTNTTNTPVKKTTKDQESNTNLVCLTEPDQNINRLENNNTNTQVNVVNISAHFNNVPSINEYFKKVINIDEAFKNNKFKNFYKNNFKNDQSFSIQNLSNLSKNKNTCDDTINSKNVKNSNKDNNGEINSLRSSKELKGEVHRTPNKIKIRIIKKDRDNIDNSNKDKGNKDSSLKDNNKDKAIKDNMEDKIEKIRTKLSNDNTNMNNLAKPPTPKKIKLSELVSHTESNLNSRNNIDNISNMNNINNNINSFYSKDKSKEKLKTLDNSFSSLKNHITEQAGISGVSLSNDINSGREHLKTRDSIPIKINPITINIRNSLANAHINSNDNSGSSALIKPKSILPSPKVIKSPKIMKNHPNMKKFFTNDS